MLPLLKIIEIFIHANVIKIVYDIRYCNLWIILDLDYKFKDMLVDFVSNLDARAVKLYILVQPVFVQNTISIWAV